MRRARAEETDGTPKAGTVGLWRVTINPLETRNPSWDPNPIFGFAGARGVLDAGGKYEFELELDFGDWEGLGGAVVLQIYD